ncbi:DUF4350 domain-containing protein [Croceicoccus sp. BE223]|uniref:DUF4350 domain-containing protein n=1 Tax=Croceicoccus sp. BE223 TaxID=2817716 RepID=UPI00286677C2|nr:DUF4350 domain-containing protein [Croceicoccus sp. BE223]MDR7101755.1 hypothetical protein [Croceicoccus sp. BE223]
MPPRPGLMLVAALLLLAACSANSPDPAPSPSATAAASEPNAKVARSDLLLFTSLPILWAEGGMADMLSADAPVHWARKVLETNRTLKPVDNLTQLPAGGTLVMAQPRALAPEENVALDNWVRAGGHLLLIVDPMLDAHSSYGLGDRRRPEAIAMLSPILARWGLRLVDDARDDHVARWSGHAVPVAEGGLFELTGQGHESRCRLGDGAAQALTASCRLGKGNVLLLGDATFLADGDNAGEGGGALLAALVTAAEAPAQGD